MIEGSQFLDLCNSQSVGLHRELSEQLGVPYPTSSLIEAIYKAGTIMSREFSPQLSEATVTLPDEFCGDTPAQALATIINSPRNPHLREGLSSFTGSDITVGSCAEAERYFSNTLTALGHVSSCGTVEPFLGSQVIVDSDNTPVIVRKAYEQASGLTLSPIAIDGVVYPAGSIVAMKIEESDRKPMSERVTVVPQEMVHSVVFKRLSDFALRPAERAEVWGGYHPKAMKRKMKLINFTLENAVHLTAVGLETVMH